MSAYHLTKRAVKDLEDIWTYTLNNWSAHQAEIYYRGLIKAFSEIAEDPNIGQSRNLVLPSLFVHRYAKHRIFYSLISPEQIEIIRILHERMDFGRHLEI